MKIFNKFSNKNDRVVKVVMGRITRGSLVS
jgi:hypothetical protein